MVQRRAEERLRPGVVAAPSSGRGEAGVRLWFVNAFRSGAGFERETRRVGFQFLFGRVRFRVQYRQGRGAFSRSVGVG